MSGQDEASRGVLALAFDSRVPLAGQHTSGDTIVAGVCVLLGIVEAVAGIRVEISSTNQLNTKSEAAFPGLIQMVCNNLGSTLLVRLVGSKDNGVSGILVVLACVLESPIIDTILQGILFSIKQKTDATLRGQLADGIDGPGQILRGGKTLGKLE